MSGELTGGKDKTHGPLSLMGLLSLFRGMSFSLLAEGIGGGSDGAGWSVMRCVMLFEKKSSID